MEPLAPLPQIPLLGEAIYVLGCVTFAVAFFPALRGLTMLRSSANWLLRMLPAWLGVKRVLEDPDRPVCVDGLSRGMASLVRQTRTLALELRERSEEAQWWPEEVAEPQPGWRSLFIDDQLADYSALVETRRQVWDWLDTAQGLSAEEHELLAGLGVDADAVREALVTGGENRPQELVRALAGLMWSFDERLAAANPGAGYRAGGADRVGAAGFVGLTPAPRFGRPGFYPNAIDDADDEDEVAQMRRRQQQLASVLATHGSSISRLAASYGRTPAEREDLEQDIALALWRALPTFRGESSLSTFVHRVARYSCFRTLRKRRPTALEIFEDGEELRDTETCPESAVLHEDDRRRMLDALAKLPDNLESTISLHLRGLSYAEIAKALGITERNVSVRISRARQRLRRELCAA
ncbi:RNA polymerase sigma-70 factor, ECF subfamily protein [Plesiocystis pacifica SIR-1]|uniref:RNA polymerase sigma-70 factor, ECF subfamily protein n=1 Tax=Plesiocystis pacifica SIR-1 TaxID=391625 RepID=A6FZT1_9BACT|nr:sigma-70 family RNA polymerase sigma factor [Plesiocystis pacifica]EDM80887.1 RNA polymerase sigma-70 factor, ECF subfamily protein [Plesiocystis pacifica SIR-1]